MTVFHRFFLYALLFLCLQAEAQIKRSRAESMPDIQASNTIGLGDIWLASYASMAALSRSGVRMEPYLALGFGLASNLSIFAGAVPFDGGVKQIIGKGDAHLKLTWPGNDNLRLFGAAVQVDLVLSTEQDTVSEGQNSKRPSYAPKAGFTLVLDADLIKRMPKLPLKAYFNFSTIDNDRLLVQFQQLSFRSGLEYKGPRNSFFLGLRFGLYQPVIRQAGEPAPAYDDNVLLLMPGYRYRLGNRFSAVGSVALALSGTERPGSDFYYERFNLRLGLEFPLFYRETNTEAIRTMIFLDTKQNEKPKTDMAEKNSETGPESILQGRLTGEDKAALKNVLQDESIIQQRDDKIKEKRKKIDEELKKIEEMLE